MVQHITFNEFLPLVLGKSGIHEHGLTLYAKVRMEEEYIEKNPRSGIYERWLSFYAKVGLQWKKNT
jgi:hypothetical protein